MTRRTALPSAEDVQSAITELTEVTGKPPTALALASRFGLANTTFRRNFPDLAHQRSVGPASSAEAATSRFDQLKADNDKLRRDNHELTEHLELAVANIQRLTLENHRLRQQLETVTKVTPHRPESLATLTRNPYPTLVVALNGLRCSERSQIQRPIALCGMTARPARD